MAARASGEQSRSAEPEPRSNSTRRSKLTTTQMRCISGEWQMTIPVSQSIGWEHAAMSSQSGMQLELEDLSFPIISLYSDSLSITSGWRLIGWSRRFDDPTHTTGIAKWLRRWSRAAKKDKLAQLSYRLRKLLRSAKRGRRVRSCRNDLESYLGSVYANVWMRKK